MGFFIKKPSIINIGSASNGGSFDPTGSRTRGGPQLTGLAAAGGAFLTGAREDPLLRPIIDNLAKLGGYDEASLDRIASQLQDTTSTSVLKFMGEWGPTLAGGVGAYTIGRAASRALLTSLGKGKAVTTGLGAAAARLTTTVPKGAKVVPMKYTQRAFEIAGGGAGYGTFEGSRTLAETGNIHEAAKDAAIATAFSVGFEGALTAIGGKVFKAFEIDPAKKLARFKSEATPLALEEIKEGKVAVSKIMASIDNELQVGNQATELIREAHQKLNYIEALEQFIKPNGGISYFTDGYYTANSFGEMLSRISLQVIRTPESFKGRGGVAMAQFLELASQAHQGIQAGEHFAVAAIGQSYAKAQKALGFKKNPGETHPMWRELWDGWETNDYNGVRDAMRKLKLGRKGGTLDEDAQVVTAAFNDMKSFMGEFGSNIEGMGGSLMITANDMSRNGVVNYLPHMGRDLPGTQMLEKLTRGKGVDEIEAAKILRELKKPLIQQRGSQDFNRKVPGSLQQKVKGFKIKGAEGILENDPWRAIYRYATEAVHRIEVGKRFGYNGEMKDVITAMAAREGDSTALMNNLIDGVLGNNYYDAGMRKLTDGFLALQIGSKMTLGVFPNMTQPMNTILLTGFKNTFKGMRKATTDDEARYIIQSMGIQDSAMTTGLPRVFGREAYKEIKTGVPSLDRFSNAADWWAWATLKYTGFSSIERWNRILSGGAGMAMYKDITAKAVGGKLRGETLNKYRRVFKQWGLDLDDITRKVKDGNWTQALDEAAQKQAIYRTAQLTQFTPSSVRRPLAWNHPLGRAIFQFKNFALGQTRFLRDAVVKEVANGNPRPLAYFLSMYPVAGELVKDAKSIIQDRPREDSGLSRLYHDTLAVGGIGLASDLMLASQFGRMGDMLLGPTISDVFQMSENYLQLNAAGEFDRIKRLPAFQVGTAITRFGFWGNDAMTDYLEKLNEAEADTTMGASLDELKLRRAGSK